MSRPRDRWRAAFALIALVALLPAPSDAQVARGVPLLEPGLPIALGTADVWPAAEGPSGVLLVFPDRARPDEGLFAALAARGHAVIAWSRRETGAGHDPEREALAFGLLPSLAGRHGEAPMLVVDGPGLAPMLAMLGSESPPVLRAIVVDARGPLDAVEPVPATTRLPPLLALLDPAEGGVRTDVIRLLVRWRAAGGDAQMAPVDDGTRALADTIDAYARSRLVRRVTRFESAVYAPDPGFDRARARFAPDARRVVGMASDRGVVRVGLDGRSARVLIEDGGTWRLDADFGPQRLVHFGPPLGSAPGASAVHAATAVADRLLVRRYDPTADRWRPRAEWPIGATVERVELHAGDGDSLRVLVDDGRVLRIWRVDVEGHVRSVPSPPGRLEAIATGHGVLAALASRGERETLWIDARGEWRAIADWTRVPGAPTRALAASPDGTWLAFGAEGSNRRIDPVGGESVELDAMATLATVAEAWPTRAAPAWFVHPETGDPLSWRPAGWLLDGSALMLWREASGRHAHAAAPGLVHLDAALPITTGGLPGAAVLVAGRDASGRVRLLRGPLPGLRPPGGWWQADDPADGGVFLAWGRDEADLHRLDRATDGRARWRTARARVEASALVAERPWSAPGGPGPGTPGDQPRSDDGDRPRLDLDPARVVPRCGPATWGVVAALLDEDDRSICLRTGRAGTPPARAPARGLWRQTAAETGALVGLSDAGPASPARDAVVLLYRDADGEPRWRAGFADPADGHGIAALSEHRRSAPGGGQTGPSPVGLIGYRPAAECGDGELVVEWRPFGDEGRLVGLPRGLGARFVRADLPACY
jgi:hypothetical protein